MIEKVGPAVVSIHAQGRLGGAARRTIFGAPFGTPPVVQGTGSGFVLSADGIVVTNNHVVDGATELTVRFPDEREMAATILGTDAETDLAVLQLDLKKNVPVMPLGHSDRVRVGDIVLAIGNPVGLSQTVTQGIVSATGRGQLGVATFENFIQTDAPINVGNSGGALINANGELVGINTAVLAKNLGVEGIGFAIPVNLVRGVMHEILTKGRVVRGWIGIVPADIDQIEARRFNLPQAGVVVAKLYVDSPAAAVGMEPRDIILTVNGVKVASAQDTLTRIANAKPGARVTITGLRGSDEFSSEVQVTERPRNR